jgi:hypothetical protein
MHFVQARPLIVDANSIAMFPSHRRREICLLDNGVKERPAQLYKGSEKEQKRAEKERCASPYSFGN